MARCALAPKFSQNALLLFLRNFSKQPLILLGASIYLCFLQQAQHPIDKSQWVNGVSGDVKIDGVFREEISVQGRTVGKDPTADGIDTGKDNNFGIRDCMVATLQRFGHIDRNGARDHDPVGMARRGHKVDPKTAHIELDVVRGVQFPLATVVATG